MDPDVAGDDNAVPQLIAAPLAAPVQRARSRPRPQRGPVEVAVLVAWVGGWWQAVEGPCDWPSLHDENLIVGLVLTQWTWSGVGDQIDDDASFLRAAETSRCEARHVRGFVQYPCLDVARLVRGRHDRDWSYHNRVAVACTNLEHRNCSRSRSCALEVERLGREAPLCFLGAWLQAAGMPEERHRAYRPSMDAMRAYKLANFGEEKKQLVNSRSHQLAASMFLVEDQPQS